MFILHTIDVVSIGIFETVQSDFKLNKHQGDCCLEFYQTSFILNKTFSKHKHYMYNDHLSFSNRIFHSTSLSFWFLLVTIFKLDIFHFLSKNMPCCISRISNMLQSGFQPNLDYGSWRQFYCYEILSSKKKNVLSWRKTFQKPCWTSTLLYEIVLSSCCIWLNSTVKFTQYFSIGIQLKLEYEHSVKVFVGFCTFHEFNKYWMILKGNDISFGSHT